MDRGLEVLLDLAEDRQQQAQRQLGEARARQNQEQAKLEQLKGFANEYRQSFNFRAGCGMSPQRLIAYRQFLDQLHTAVSQQSDHYDQSEAKVGECIGELQQSRQGYESLSLLRQRRHEQFLAKEEKQQQRDADEFSLRQFQLAVESR